MIELETKSNLKDFVGTYNTWLRRIQPQERLCINEKMADRGRTALVGRARRHNLKDVGRFISGEATRTGVSFVLGTGSSGRGRGVRFNRGAQLLQLMATGGRVRFIAGRRIQGLWIIKDKRFSTAGALRLLRKTRNEGTKRESGGQTIWFGPNRIILFQSSKGLTLVRSNKSARNSVIMFLPAKATFKKRFDVLDVVSEAINRNLERDAEQCFNENTLKHFNQARRSFSR